ncbi:hypothetical protein BGU93_19220 [Clostridioides difficile]|nr:hypothetical protein BGU93_19220 [Clostridioides difficile]
MRDNSEKQIKQFLGRQKTGKNSIDEISGQGAMPYRHSIAPCLTIKNRATLIATTSAQGEPRGVRGNILDLAQKKR